MKSPRTSEAVQGTIAQQNLEHILFGADLDDPTWRNMMRGLLANISPGEWSVGTDELVALEKRGGLPIMAAVTGQESGESRPILAKCGLFEDSASCFDAIAIAACVNAVRKRLTGGA